ncbi:MAG: hypothetical protein ACQGVC_03085 [Myxococcota bacterium]
MPPRDPAAIAFAVGFVVLLITLPAWVAPDPDVLSAAAADGYDTAAAYWTLLAWALIGVAGFAIRDRGQPAPDPAAPDAPATGRLDWTEIGLVFAVFALACFPLFLVRHAPYGEDQYFLTSLHRMACGQVPYRDFGFLYGPLMLYPAWGVAQLFGLSMTSYYAFLALLEGLQFALLAAALQVFLPRRRDRVVAFALLLPFLFDTMLGLNWNGMRRLVPAGVALLLAHRPYDRRALLWAAGIVGLHLAYSHEYAGAGLLAVGGTYGVAWLRGERRAFGAAALLGLGSLVVWIGSAFLLMGGDAPAYFRHLLEIVEMMSGGHAGFRFYWTANSLALFGLLSIACVTVGSGLLRRSDRPLASGDRLLLAGLLYALVVLKSGMNRCDHWHLNAPFLVLFLTFLLPLPANLWALSGGARRLGFALVCVASATYLLGIAPTGSLYAERWVRGAVDVLTGRERPAPVPTRTTAFEFERSEPREDFVAIGRFLAEPERAGLPVYFYGRAWQVAPMVGVCREDYALDDLMYTERARPPRVWLEENPDALIVLRRDAWDRLYGDAADAGVDWLDLTPAKQLARWLSTVHYESSATEAELQNRARDGDTGAWIRPRYRVAREFQWFLVLEPK